MEPGPFALTKYKMEKLKFSFNDCKIQGGKASIFDLKFVIFNLGQVSLNIFSRTKDVHGLPPLFNVGADTMLKGGHNHTSLVLSITNPPLHHFHAPFAIIFATRVTREAQKTLKIKHDIRLRTAARRQAKAKGGQMHMYMGDAQDSKTIIIT